jgi:hypothetical protein
MQAHHVDASTGEDEIAAAELPPAQQAPKPKRVASDPGTWGKVGRNEPCPCGSGKNTSNATGRWCRSEPVRRASPGGAVARGRVPSPELPSYGCW